MARDTLGAGLNGHDDAPTIMAMGPCRPASRWRCAAASTGPCFEAVDPPEQTFYTQLKPISIAFEEEALAASGLHRGRLAAEGRDPIDAMTAVAAWVKQVSTGATSVLVAYPLGSTHPAMQEGFYILGFLEPEDLRRRIHRVPHR
jgi:hypothetical protein